MPTRKETLQDLLTEAGTPMSSLEANADASDDLRTEVSSLRAELMDSRRRSVSSV